MTERISIMFESDVIQKMVKQEELWDELSFKFESDVIQKMVKRHHILLCCPGRLRVM